MSSREKYGGSLDSKSYYLFKYWNWHDPPSPWGTYVGALKDTRWEMRGNNTPGFHRRKKRGELLPLKSYFSFKTVGDVHSGEYEWRDLSSGAGYGFIGGASLEEDWIITSQEAEEIATNYLVDLSHQVAAALYNKNTMDALTFVLELNKTLDLLKAPVERAIKLMKDPKGWRGSGPSSWLEYRYGWRILYYDVLSFIKASNRIGDLRTRFSERVGFDQEVTLAPVVHTQSAGPPGTFQRTIQTSISLSNRGFAIADLNCLNPFQINPAVSGWEVMRWSFILDWIIAIGDYIQAMSLLVTANSAHFANSVKCTITREMARSSAPNSGYSLIRSGFATSVAEVKLRVPTSPPKYPLPSLSLDGQKIFDLIAILRSKKGALLTRR
jgi:hypothetical protein